MPELKVVPLYESNYRDAVATLRKLADDIENGVYGTVQDIAVVTYGDTLEVFGMGEKTDGGTTVLLLAAGQMRLVSAVERQGR